MEFKHSKKFKNYSILGENLFSENIILKKLKLRK